MGNLFVLNIIKLNRRSDCLQMQSKAKSTIKAEGEPDGPEVQSKLTSGHKPYLSKFQSKKTPVGPLHQVEVPELRSEPSGAAPILQQDGRFTHQIRSRSKFLASRVDCSQLDKYLTFVEGYFEEKNTDYFNQGSASKERTKARAMDFLHDMDYNYTKAKFYILFPYYIRYNQFRCHNPLSISVEDMEKKIKDHLERLRNTKERDMEKWVENLDASLEARIPYSKLCLLVEAGKQNRYDLPQHIKEQIEKSLRGGKELKKSLQGSKFSMQALIEKKEALRDCRVVTTDMVSFEDAVNRCEEWTIKQEQFQAKYLQLGEDGSFVIKESPQKIEFKKIQHLYNEYSNLPISHPIFEQTTKKLYIETNQLLEKMPTFNKIVKTRTSKEITASKIPYAQMQAYLDTIQKYKISHEEFESFEKNMRESLELLERVSMFLEDSHSEKNNKVLNNYLKLISDIQIENKVEKLLKDKLETNQIMDGIKKFLSNPSKVESVKEAVNRLKEKGIKVEDSGYQEKIMLYLGWYESQQKLKSQRIVPNNLELVLREEEIKRRLVESTKFWEQLESAKKELSISEESLQEAYSKQQRYQENVSAIKKILECPEPALQDMINLLHNCLNEGLSFPEFSQLYEIIIKYFTAIAKIHFLLRMNSDNIEPEHETEMFFTSQQTEEIMSVLVYQSEIRDLKSKEGADQLLQEISQPPFPTYLKECQLFREFMTKGEQWAHKVRELIRDFREKGEAIDIKELEESRYFLHSKAIKEEIGKVEFIMKWRQKIAKKLQDYKVNAFDEEDEEFMIKLKKDLVQYESLKAENCVFQQHFIEYCRDNERMIHKMLEAVGSKCQLDSVCKLSEMNKFHREIEKEIEKHKIDDKKIFELKQSFHAEILQAEEWKEKYHIVKRFEKKKMLKKGISADQPDEPVDNSEKNAEDAIEGFIELTPENNGRKKFQIKNGEFTWYFKLLIMLQEFYQGYRLKFCLEEMQRLKGSLTEIHRFCSNYYRIFSKRDPFDYELSTLKSEGSKIPIFIRECWLLERRCSYVDAWKALADCVLDSIPIVRMELKARKPSELIAVFEKKKQETEEANSIIDKQRSNDQFSQKRSRKPNTLYVNNDTALLIDDNIGPKAKKRRKGNHDGEYRNTSVTQSKKSIRSEIEEIERAEALLKDKLTHSEFLSEEGNQQYCLCRNGELNENSTMVQCEGKCREWFHIECIGVKKHQVKGDYRYLCIGCRTLYDDIESHGSFYWDYHSKISEYAFNEIVDEGKRLGVQTEQLKRILIVHSKMKGWKQRVEEVLQNVMRDDLLGNSLAAHSDKLYELYLLSLWLPTFHPESNTIRRVFLFSKQGS